MDQDALAHPASARDSGVDAIARDRRWRVGAVAWAASGLLLPLQLLVAMQWPDGYSFARNAISDLGVTHCGVFTDAATTRGVCSPWHVAFNAGLVACGSLTTFGAIMLYHRWRGLSGRAGIILVAVSGLFVVTVGLAPWDVSPDLHDAAALGQAGLQWLAMVLLATSAGAGRFRIITLATVAVSVVAFVLFLARLDGMQTIVLPLGLAERLAFDTLTLWTTLTGAALLVASRGHPGTRPSAA